MQAPDELRADHHTASAAQGTTFGSATRKPRTPSSRTTTSRTSTAGVYGVLEDSRGEEDHDVRGLCRAPRTGEIPDTGSPRLACVPTPRDEAWCEFGLGLGEVSSVSPSGAVEQIPKLPLNRLQHWNDVLIFQKPDYETPMEKQSAKETKKATKEMAKMANPSTPATSSMRPPATSILVGQQELLAMDIGTPRSKLSGLYQSGSEQMAASDREQDEMNLWRLDAASAPQLSPPALMQACPHCPTAALTCTSVPRRTG